MRVSGYLMFVTGTLGEPEAVKPAPMQPRLSAPPHRLVRLRPIGRLMPVAALRPEPEAAPHVRTLRPVRSGRAFRITSPPARGLVTPELAEALETVFERFANERGFTPDKPVEIRLARGWKASSHGHYEGRAADIADVVGKGLLVWKQEWDQAMNQAEKLADSQQRTDAKAAEQRRNLGYGLYKALQAHGGWRVNKAGWRVYRGVMQLFGPWTATEGPWKAVQIADPTPEQQQRLRDQQWVFRAHQDHIHVAR